LALEMPFFTHSTAVLLLLLGIALLAGAGALVHFASLRAGRSLDDVDLEGIPLRSFSGGLRWPLPARLGVTNTSPMLVGLELFEWGVRMRARWSWLRPFVPTWCARFEEISAAEYVRRGLRLSKRGSEGVRFRAPLTGTPLIFWTSSASSLLDALEAHDVAVLRRATALRFWTNG